MPCVLCRMKPFLKFTIDGVIDHSGENVDPSNEKRTRYSFTCIDACKEMLQCCSWLCFLCLKVCIVKALGGMVQNKKEREARILRE